MNTEQLSQAAHRCNSEPHRPNYAVEKIVERYRVGRELAREVARLAGVGPQEEVKP